jgi:epsin
MQEIANGTHSYQQLNEIMPLIYKRFTDKTAEEWRQIYKSLQLLEFLVKNGSERVIDDARSHLGLLRMLKQFHYIDPNGKDQGVNVRNRAQELSKLLSDVDAIRSERKKARANRNKYGGVEGGGGFGGSGNRYGGFSSDEASYGNYGGQVYGDGGGFGGQENSSNFHDTQRRGDQFEEYDEGDEVSAPVRPTRTTKTTVALSTSTRAAQKAPARVKEPEEDLLGFDEPASSSANGKAPAMSNNDFGDFGAPAAADEDDFDDFQSASPGVAQPPIGGLASLSPPPPTTSTTTSSTQYAAPKPLAAHQTPNYTNIFATTSPAPSGTITPSSSTTFTSTPPQAAAAPKPAPYKPTGPNYFTSVPVAPVTGSTTPSFTSSTSTSTSAFSSLTPQPRASSTQSAFSAANLGKPTTSSQSKPASSNTDAFSNLWTTASSKAGVQTKNANADRGPNLADLAKQKSSAGIWGMASQPAGKNGGQSQSQGTGAGTGNGTIGNGLDDLLG